MQKRIPKKDYRNIWFKPYFYFDRIQKEVDKNLGANGLSFYLDGRFNCSIWSLYETASNLIKRSYYLLYLKDKIILPWEPDRL